MRHAERLPVASPAAYRVRWAPRAYGPLPAGAVYVGRPSPWGNPHRIEKPGDVAAHLDTVDAYRQHLAAHPELLARLPELAGKGLACGCAPGLPCHADVLVELVNRARVFAVPQKRGRLREESSRERA